MSDKIIGLYALTRRQRDTVLAALRNWQAENVTEEGDIACSIALQDIATNGLEQEPLTRDEIDTLCEEVINTRGVSTGEELERILAEIKG